METIEDEIIRIKTEIEFLSQRLEYLREVHEYTLTGKLDVKYL